MALACGLFYSKLLAAPALPDPVSDDYLFDENLMFGVGSVARFNQANAIEPGEYTVEVYLNNRFFQRMALGFLAVSDKGVQPCLSATLLENAGVKHDAITAPTADECLILAQAVEGASLAFDLATLRLDVRVPQSLMNQRPQGYVPPESLDSGETLGFVNYNLNHYHVSRTGSTSGRTDSSFAVFNSGVNLGLWRLRQQGSVRYNAEGTDWNSARLYLQRPLPSLNSELTLGENYTPGRFFSGIGYRGLELGSDERMLPESIRGYAPTVRGIAQSNANVRIRQGGEEIYQTVVPPGPFEISDLYATRYDGDLQVTVEEAGGRISQFTVPFSAVAESLRPGASRYNVTLAQTRDVGTDTPFTELTFQHGLSNAITINSGVRLAQNYQAWVLGGVYANWLGAFGLDTTYARARDARDGHLSGWLSRLSYSRTFESTDTLLTVAGYRYFSAGYREFDDVLEANDARHSVTGSSIRRDLPHTRWDVALNQDLDVYGSIYVSASTQTYRGGHARDTQLQLGYSQMFDEAVSFNVSVARQRTGPSQNDDDDDATFAPGLAGSTGFGQVRVAGTTETLILLSVSFALGSPANVEVPMLNSSISQSANYGGVYQTSLFGVTGEEQSLNYGFDVSHDAAQRQNTYSANLQKRLSNGAIGMSASQGRDYWQASASGRGALAVHRGGITFGPYLGDTFALVHAKGATGASVLNGQGAHIDAAGFALVPSLTPYRYNTIAIDPQGMDTNTELEEGQRRVAPLAGAAVKVEFKTRSGTALLITAHLPDGQAIPMGAEVIDAQGGVVGMVGQGSQAYLRSEASAGQLTIRWGEEPDTRCVLTYDLDGLDLKQPLLRLERVCRMEGSAP
jgi:outer membrane usher protein